MRKRIIGSIKKSSSIPERDWLDLERLADVAQTAGIPCKTIHVRHRRPSAAILDAAKAQACDLIVMGSQTAGSLAAVVLGSETLAVLTHGDTPVIVYPHG